jgi:hypothetical protein
LQSDASVLPSLQLGHIIVLAGSNEFIIRDRHSFDSRRLWNFGCVAALVLGEVLLLLLLLLLMLLWTSWARKSASMSSKSSVGSALFLVLPLAGIVVKRVTLFK